MSACIRGITSMATRRLLCELARSYDRGCVEIEAAGGVDVARRVGEGEAFDFVILAAPAIDSLAAAGRVDPGTRVDIARSSIAVAVAAGAQHPHLNDEQAVKDAVAAAMRIGLSTGPSGKYLRRLFERWRVLPEKIVEAPVGVPVASLLVRGDIDLAFQQLSELMNVPGVDVVGVLPEGIQEITVFAGAVCVTSDCRAEARDVLAYCASPRTDPVKRRYGMEPA
jgi:molybdate transport system substrate-binding protein